MFRNTGKAIIATLAFSQAARVKIDSAIQLDVAPPSNFKAGVEKSERRHCAIWNFQAFQQMVSDCPQGSSTTDSMAMAIAQYGQADADAVFVSNHEAASLSAMNTPDTAVDLSLCAEGQLFMPCAQSLPSMLWLRQFWRLEDLSQSADLSTADRVKTRVFSGALQNYGISHSRLHSQCAREIKNPSWAIMRECVLNSVPAFVLAFDKNNVGEMSVAHGEKVELQVQNPVGEMIDLSDAETFKLTLESWLRGLWEKDDMIRGLHHTAGRRFRRGCRAARHRVQDERDAYEASILATHFPLKHSGVTQACHNSSPSAVAASGIFERIIGEMGACAGAGENCTEQEHPCPEGFKCDCQHLQREGTNLAVGAAMGGVAGLAVGVGLPFVLAGAAGLAFAPELALSWAYGSLLLGGKAEVGAVGASLGSLELSSSCMCFAVECTYDKKTEQCEMKPSESSTVSSNPFSTLPFNGLKCVEHKNHHWFHSGKVCDLSECDHYDAAEVGPAMAGQQLFGRVGRSVDWKASGVFNCASTEGTVDSLLARLASIPSPAGEAVENTVEGRMEILRQFS